MPARPRDVPLATLVFATPRLVARRIEWVDVDALFAVYGDRAVVRWVDDGEPLARAQCAQWVEVTHRNYATRGYGMYAVSERRTTAVVGFCGLVHPGGQDDAEIKYALHRDWWGKGLATEAATALLAHGAAQLGLAKVIATTAPANAASQRVLLKAGMRRDALRRNDDGTFTQVFVWRPADAAASGPP